MRDLPEVGKQTTNTLSRFTSVAFANRKITKQGHDQLLEKIIELQQTIDQVVKDGEKRTSEVVTEHVKRGRRKRTSAHTDVTVPTSFDEMLEEGMVAS